MDLLEFFLRPAVSMVFVSFVTILSLSIEVYKNRKPSYWMLALPCGVIAIHLISEMGPVKLPGLSNSSQELFLFSIFGSPFVFLFLIWALIWVDEDVMSPNNKLKSAVVGTVIIYIMFFLMLVADG